MYKPNFNKRFIFKFKHFSNKRYSLFSVLGKEVLVGTLSVATLSHAKAEGISTDVSKVSADSAMQTKTYELDEVQVTASRAPLTLSQQARMVTVLGREDIAAAPVQSVNDLLKYAVGVDVRQRGPLGAQTDVGIRGGNYEQVTILLNGININDPQTGHNAFDFPVDLSEIERIEVLEGPAGRAYGTSSLLGAINIVTKIPSKSSMSVNVKGGSYGYWQAGTRVNLAKGLWNNSFSASYSKSDGYQRSKSGKLNSDYSGGKIFYQGIYNDGLWKVNWHCGMSTKGFGSNTFYSAYSDEQYERTLKTYTAIQAENIQGKFHIRPSIYWNRNFDKWELFHQNPAAYPYNYHRTDIYGVNLNGYFDWKLGRTGFGAELRNEDLVSGNLGEKLQSPKHIHGTDRDYEYGMNRTNVQFAIEHNILLDNFTMSLGAVAVKNSWSEMHMQVYPSVDAGYSIDKHWKLYASYNSSLRMPSATELYYNSKGYNANHNLKPEELSALEFGVKYQSRPFWSNISVYYNRMKNLIDWIIDTNSDSPVLTTTNFGKINSVGVELNSYVDFQELLPFQTILKKLQVSYAYANQEQAKYDGIVSQYILEYLRHKIVADLRFNAWKKMDINIIYRFQKRNGGYVSGYDEVRKVNVFSEYSPYSVVDARVSWVEKLYTFYCEANNILSHRYVDFGRLKQPGIWVNFGVSLNMNL